MIRGFLLVFLVCPYVFAVDDSTKIAIIKGFSNVAPSREAIYANDFESVEEDLPAGFGREAGEGRGGSSALVYRRSNPGDYRVFTVRLNGLDPGHPYRATVWTRGRDIVSTPPNANKGVLCAEYSRDGNWIGGTYCSTPEVGVDWAPVSLLFRIEEGCETDLRLYLSGGMIGTIYFDDLDVAPAAIPPTIVLVRPDRLSFQGDDRRLAFRVESTAPENSRLWLTVTNGQSVEEMLLEPEGLNFRGRVGSLKRGPVEIVARLADMDAKRVVAEQTFRLNADPGAIPLKNACTIDEFGRAIIAGKPFMPLGVFGFVDEENCRRLKDAGFNCLQSYDCLHLKGAADRGNPVDNVLDAMDMLERHGLKLIFSLNDQYAHKTHVRKSWAGVRGFDRVSEAAVRAVKDHPALLAWYVSDEELRNNVPLVLGLRERIGRIDPWHPTWTLTDRHDSLYLPYYGISGDVIGVDPYPITMDDREQSIATIKEAMLAARSTGLPCWVAPQIFNWGVYRLADQPEKFALSRFPSMEEMRAMPLYAAMYGARGFVFFSNTTVIRRYEKLLPGSAEREWAKVVEAIEPLRELEPFILAASAPEELVVTSDPPGVVEAALFSNDRGDYRIVIVGTGGPTRGKFTLPPRLAENGPFRSKFGKTTLLGKSVYEFKTDGVGSDILERK